MRKGLVTTRSTPDSFSFCSSKWLAPRPPPGGIPRLGSRHFLVPKHSRGKCRMDTSQLKSKRSSQENKSPLGTKNKKGRLGRRPFSVFLGSSYFSRARVFPKRLCSIQAPHPPQSQLRHSWRRKNRGHSCRLPEMRS